VIQILLNALGGGSLLQGLGVVLLAASGLAYLGGKIFRAESDVQRRIQSTPAPGRADVKPASSRVKTALASLGSRVAETDGEDAKVLRGKLIQAGFYAPQAVVIFFAIRLFCAIFLALTMAAALIFWGSIRQQTIALATVGTAAVGYLAPSLILTRLIQRNRDEHRVGFPDMMDLMIVCSQAGLSMEAGIQRIAGEIASAYPSLARNLDWATREIRSGKQLSRAIESLALRLGIEEAMSFSILLQQSEELGSSLTQSLRAYSDDMRNKRLMKAEEKAYALPAKLVVPLTLFVFPVLLMVIILPAIIGVMAAKG
jgi:tight adherence protein C